MSVPPPNEKVVLITGAAQGIGRATAEMLARQGWEVVLSDVNQGVLKTTLEDLTRAGLDVSGIPCDVSQPSSIQSLVDKIMIDHGRLDGLVNNAGIGGTGKTLLELELDEWNAMLRVNLTSVFLTCKAVVPHMIRQGRGNIINLSSISALMGVAGSTHYTAAKGGVIAFTKSLAREVAPHRINVNAIAPGLIDTPLAQKRGIDHQRHLVLWPRIGQPEDIASAVAFLLSDGAEFMTGQVLHPNGGAFM